MFRSCWSAPSCFCVLVASSRTSFLSQRSPVGPLFPPKKSLQFLNTHGRLRVTSESSQFTGFFTRGEKGKGIQKAVWILKTSAADAKDTQKGFTSVASQWGGGDCFAFRKREFSLFLKPTFSLGCSVKNALCLLSDSSRRFLEAPWRRRLSYSLS